MNPIRHSVPKTIPNILLSPPDPKRVRSQIKLGRAYCGRERMNVKKSRAAGGSGSPGAAGQRFDDERVFVELVRRLFALDLHVPLGLVKAWKYHVARDVRQHAGAIEDVRDGQGR